MLHVLHSAFQDLVPHPVQTSKRTENSTLHAMGRSEKGPPEISLERLRSLPAEEQSYYWKLFKKLGGRRRPVPKSAVKQFLVRSQLDPEVLENILSTAVDSADDVDFEKFCVMCRLVSQAQESGFLGSVSDIPSNPAWFAEQSFEGEQPSEFDFEAVAFGVDSPGGGRSEPAAGCLVWCLKAQVLSCMPLRLGSSADKPASCKGGCRSSAGTRQLAEAGRLQAVNSLKADAS